MARERRAVRGRTPRRGCGVGAWATARGGGAHPGGVRGDPLRLRVGLLEGSGEAGPHADKLAFVPHTTTRWRAMSLFTAIALMSFVAAPVPKDDPAKEELAALQGEWKQVKFIKNGIPVLGW